MACLPLCMAPAWAADCSVTSAILNFGNYDSFYNFDNISNGAVRVTCRKTATLAETVSVTVQLAPSPAGAYGARRLTLGASELSFDVFTDLLRQQAWGDGTGSTGVLSGLLVLTAVTPEGTLDLPVFGRMQARQPAAAGTYNGLFTITVNF